MKLSRIDLERIAVDTGFQVEPLEKVLHLLDLLESLRSHPYLLDRLALKGGTAVNLFMLDAPRLSVDIDLNYIGSVDRATMLAERPRVEEAIHAVCGRQDVRIRRVPGEHAGGKWRLAYGRADGGQGTLELDLNFLLRTPLWTPWIRDSAPIGSLGARQIRVLDPHELAAGKLAALFDRTASRDLFDVHTLLKPGGLDQRRLRLGFVLYGSVSRRDWRTVSTDRVGMDPVDADRQLLPLLRAEIAPARRDLKQWCARLLDECRERLSVVLPLEAREIEFVSLVNDRGEIAPNLLTDDLDLQGRIRSHPALLWKALNVRKRAGLSIGTGTSADSGAGGDTDRWH